MRYRKDGFVPFSWRETDKFMEVLSGSVGDESYVKSTIWTAVVMKTKQYHYSIPYYDQIFIVYRVYYYDIVFAQNLIYEHSPWTGLHNVFHT